MEQVRAVLQKYWGYDSFRPLQAEAMRAVLEGRDSVIVLPTGGGKSLCFQAPALCLPGMAVVVSPLISLMKDQVDALTGCGIAAACVNSSLSAEERHRVADEIRAERLKLLYVSPERLNTERMLDFLKTTQISFFAVDEAHCISDWGHDFRPEYRMLRRLKDEFDGIAVHAYTATATEHVREDIARELNLQNPEVIVGSFDRPNLVYRVQPRSDLLRQVCEVLDRHKGESGVIYCIRRADVDDLCADLSSRGYRVLPYHAGMSDEHRRRNQEAFIQEKVETIVATVAFGMGIDKSNVRYVIHAGAPKTLENYQQESGRAGRDGLEAECCLFYSGQDFRTWKKLQSDLPAEAYEIAMTKLEGIERFCLGVTCRHGSLVEYFGEAWPEGNCGACDVCLSELDLVDDALVTSQKILSCVVRQQQNYGADYTAQVLTGSREQRILDNGHDQLSTYGLLKNEEKKTVRNWIEQLVGQGCLKKYGEYNVLQVTPLGREVLRGEFTPRLMRPVLRPKKESKIAASSWEGVDRGLFEKLRTLRRSVADDRAMPTWLVFSDATLRDMARRRPGSVEEFLQVNGVGEKKSAEFASLFLPAIAEYCGANNLPLGPGPVARPSTGASRPASRRAAAIRERAFELFAEHRGIEEVAEMLGRAVGTTCEYLAEFIEQEQIDDPSAWVNPITIERIARAAESVGMQRLKPLFETLGGDISYDQIRIVIACLKNRSGKVSSNSTPAAE